VFLEDAHKQPMGHAVSVTLVGNIPTHDAGAEYKTVYERTRGAERLEPVDLFEIA
jgi:hypothetical protein